MISFLILVYNFKYLHHCWRQSCIKHEKSFDFNISISKTAHDLDNGSDGPQYLDNTSNYANCLNLLLLTYTVTYTAVLVQSIAQFLWPKYKSRKYDSFQEVFLSRSSFGQSLRKCERRGQWLSSLAKTKGSIYKFVACEGYKEMDTHAAM